MATDVIMPALGVAQEKGTLLNWLKAEGQSVTKGEPLMEIETDKATVEIEAPASGILANVTASAGDEVPVGNKIAVILAPGEVATPAEVQDPHPRIESGPGSGPEPSPRGRGKSEAQSRATTRERESNPPISPFVKGGSKVGFSRLRNFTSCSYAYPRISGGQKNRQRERHRYRIPQRKRAWRQRPCRRCAPVHNQPSRRSGRTA